ncbi:MAG TPA: hypothetical protein VKI19_06800 [Acidimicrobiales bacterium]|nr:hypothetical protein [Acidimicrobiales bacterium]
MSDDQAPVGPEQARALALRLWKQVEPFHSLYLAPEGDDAYAAASLKGGWRRYFAARSSPLGAVAPEVVVAAFYGFHPRLVGRSLPSVGETATVEAVRAARLEAVDAAMANSRWSQVPSHPDLARAVELLDGAAARCPLVGRALFAAHAALPAPEAAHLRLWWYATLLREHRGDGHVAALVAAGIGPSESLVLHCATGELTRDDLQPLRGWTDEEWDATSAALVDRGWPENSGEFTAAGRRRRDGVEAVTDDLAAGPWLALDDGQSLSEAVEVLDRLLAA